MRTTAASVGLCVQLLCILSLPVVIRIVQLTSSVHGDLAVFVVY